MTDARVKLWGSTIGAVSWLSEREIGVFQYASEFINSGIQVAPLTMPLREFPYDFPSLPRTAFRGLPGLVADSLPDKFGNAVINAWLSTQGRTPDSFNPVERLCYIGSRGMGALEYEPALREPYSTQNTIEVAQLVQLANRILSQREDLLGSFTGKDDRQALENILRVGTSAGGARAKAILAWNPKTGAFRSGQTGLKPGYEHWLLKFDGISNNRDKELADPQGYGKIEFAYYLMARKAGIKMTSCRLHHEEGRSHFMTKRFDRDNAGGKLHMQTLGAIAHYDYNLPGAYSYEQALIAMKQLDLTFIDMEQMLIRAIFNVIGRNQDDHVKNLAFLMDHTGKWQLAPAYDMTYAYDPLGNWTSQHQMSINQKRRGINRNDLVALANQAGIKQAKANDLIDKVGMVFQRWEEFAAQAGVNPRQIDMIQRSLHVNL